MSRRRDDQRAGPADRASLDEIERKRELRKLDAQRKARWRQRQKDGERCPRVPMKHDFIDAMIEEQVITDAQADHDDDLARGLMFLGALGLKILSRMDPQRRQAVLESMPKREKDEADARPRTDDDR